jgi:glycine dehydrogenase subunit 1
MNCGGGEFGFIATSDDAKFVLEHPTLLVGMTDTIEKGEYGFGWCGFDTRTSFGVKNEKGGIRSEAKDFTGTTACLWAIAAAVYMALMGPNGFKEIGELIIERSHYAIRLLSEIRGIRIPLSPNVFKEFVVNFNETNKSVRDINLALLEHNIFGGKDISAEFPELGNNALYCVTEIHSQGDIEKLASALEEVLSR